MRHKVIIGLPRWQTIGPAIFADRLVRALLAHGHDARVLLTEVDSTLINPSQPIETPPEDLPCDKLPCGSNDTWGQRWEALERFLEEQAPCIYFMLHDWRNNIVASRLSKRVKLIGLVQADSELELNQAMRLGRYWDAIVAVSEPIQFKLCTHLPDIAPRILTIRNGVPTVESIPLKSSDGPLTIAYSGELRVGQKRLDDMIAIAHQLDLLGIDYKLTLFGDGPHRQALEAQCPSLIEKGRVVFRGVLGSEQLLQELSEHHVFLLTSEYEGLSIAMLEAMSRGCVPVTSKLTSQSYLVQNNKTGLTAKVGDVEGFVEQLARLAEDRVLLANLAAQAFKAIESKKCRLQDMVDSYISLLDQISTDDASRRFTRARMDISLPPQNVDGIDILLGDLDLDQQYVNQANLWPDPPRLPALRPHRHGTETVIGTNDFRVIVSYNPSAISGVDVFARLLVEGLVTRGIDARLDCQPTMRDGYLDDAANDLPVEERDPALDQDYLGWPQRWRRKAAQLESLAPCIYIPNYDSDYSCIAPLLSAGVRVIGIAHSDDPWHYEHISRIGHACEAIVGVSSVISNHIRNLVTEWADRIHTIPYGIQPPRAIQTESAQPRDQVNQAPAPLRILYSGRLVCRQKRVLDLVSIARKLESRDVPFELAIVGDGELRSQLEHSALDLIRNRIVWFTGSQPSSGVFELLDRSDVFLLPSAFEGLSLSLLEAMSRGVVPVVTSIRSGVPDLIRPGVNGLIAPVGDCTALADCLEWLWRNPTERDRLSREAASTIQHHYHLDQMIEAYVNLFQSVLNNPLPRPIGAVVPAAALRRELSWSSWAGRVLSDPAASIKRVMNRFFLNPG